MNLFRLTQVNNFFFTIYVPHGGGYSRNSITLKVLSTLYQKIRKGFNLLLENWKVFIVSYYVEPQ